MSNFLTGAERMSHDLSHLGFLACQLGRLIHILTTSVIAVESLDMVYVGALLLSPLRRGLAYHCLLAVHSGCLTNSSANPVLSSYSFEIDAIVALRLSAMSSGDTVHGTVDITTNYFIYQAEDGIRYFKVTRVQTCALPI